MQPKFIHIDGLYIINQFKSLPITEIHNNNSNLEKGIDFLLKYQFEEILSNVFQKLRHNMLEELYEIEFELIKCDNTQNILIYNFYETINPMIRNKCVINYISKICIICWKMIMFSHKKIKTKIN